MNQQLQSNFANLSDVFPDFHKKIQQNRGFIVASKGDGSNPKIIQLRSNNGSGSSSKNPTEPPPNYSESVLASQIETLRNLKPYGRLCRAENNEIKLETRWRILRTDSRWTALEDLSLLLSQCNDTQQQVVKSTIQILIDTTYKNDSKWVKEAYKVLIKH